MSPTPMDPERIKSKSMRLLSSQGIDVISHLPILEQPKFRPAKDVARRCVILAALLQLRFGAPLEFITDYLEENELTSYLSPHEIHTLKVGFSGLNKQDQIDLYWNIEAAWALAWVGTKHANLSLNTGVEDSLASMLPNFENSEPAAEFVQNFVLRDDIEIFEILDLFYRAHWFARANGRSEDVVKIADLDLIMERRRALEWVCYENEKWDEISLDT